MKALVTAAVICIAASGALAKTRHIHSEMSEAVRNGSRGVAVGDVNGGWSVDAATTVGQCAGLIPSGLEIVDGRVTGASGLAGESWGYVDGDGQIVARFTTSGGHVARFHGNLRSGHGSGAWSSSTDYCGGTWRATRGGQESAAR